MHAVPLRGALPGTGAIEVIRGYGIPILGGSVPVGLRVKHLKSGTFNYSYPNISRFPGVLPQLFTYTHE